MTFIQGPLRALLCNWTQGSVLPQDPIRLEAGGLTTKYSDVPFLMCSARVLSTLLYARTRSMKGGFCPDSSASELPA